MQVLGGNIELKLRNIPAQPFDLYGFIIFFISVTTFTVWFRLMISFVLSLNFCLALGRTYTIKQDLQSELRTFLFGNTAKLS